jgi:hypothetical protein
VPRWAIQRQGLSPIRTARCITLTSRAAGRPAHPTVGRVGSCVGRHCLTGHIWLQFPGSQALILQSLSSHVDQAHECVSACSIIINARPVVKKLLHRQSNESMMPPVYPAYAKPYHCDTVCCNNGYMHMVDGQVGPKSLLRVSV